MVYRSWRRRADSNRRIGVLQTPALDRLATSPCWMLGNDWCRGGDSNSYSLFGHSALNAACLPIPPPRRNGSLCSESSQRVNYSQKCGGLSTESISEIQHADNFLRQDSNAENGVIWFRHVH